MKVLFSENLGGVGSPKVINLKSDTFGKPICQKGLTRLAILPNDKCPKILCLALPPCPKSGLILVKKVVLRFMLPKNHFTNKGAPKLLFLSEKNNRKDSGDF